MVRKSRPGTDYPVIRFKKLRPNTGISEIIRSTTYGKNIQAATRELLGGFEDYNPYDYTLVYMPRLKDNVKFVEIIKTPSFFGLETNDAPSPYLIRDQFHSYFWRIPPLYGTKMYSLFDPETGEIRFED